MSAATDHLVRWSLGGLQSTGVRAPRGWDRGSHDGHGSSYAILATAPGIAVHDVGCDWTAGARMFERFTQFGLCLVRRGMFIRRTPRAELLVDPTTAVFEQRDFEQEIVHPQEGTGEPTVILLSDEAMLRFAGDLSVPDVLIPVEPADNVRHLALVSDLRQSHLARVLRRAVGSPPSALRQRFGGENATTRSKPDVRGLE